MQRFLRIETDNDKVLYLNYDRIERIEIQSNLTAAAISLIDQKEPIMVSGDNYASLIDRLGDDQEEK